MSEKYLGITDDCLYSINSCNNKLMTAKKITVYKRTNIRNGFISILRLSILLFFFQQLYVSKAFAEGTKEIMPTSTYIGRLNFEPSFTNFAMYGCLPSERLNIHIANVGEKIYYGFGQLFDANQFLQSDMLYRIRDPNGNIVVNASYLPTSGAGFIQSYAEAVAGPNAIAVGGYTPLSYTAASTGDYYIEFYYPYSSSIGDRRELEFFDITVCSPNNQKIDGRVWSKEWQFTVTVSAQPNPYNNPFYGKLYIYTKDSIVTSVDFNGLKPYVFAMSANSTGTANTGNPIQDRKSKAGRHTYPEFKIFLNDPDTIVYPSGVLGSFLAPISVSGCPGNYCINISINKAGAMQLLIDLNGIPGFQIGTEDIMLTQNINAGQTCVPWDGIDGLGNQVADGTTIKIKATFVGGLTHMPIYDAETNPSGYIVNLVRPITTSSTYHLYWDDSNFPNSTYPPSNGCYNSNGCHSYPYMFGDQRTINTWWYASSDIVDSLTFIYSPLSLDSIVTQNASCPNISDGMAQVFITGGNAPISYALNNGMAQNNNLFSNLSIGNYLITISDSQNCVLSDTFSISSSPMVLATTYSNNDTCNANIGSVSVAASGGNGPLQYLWNTNPLSSLTTVNNIGSGVYTLSITDVNNCVFTFSDTVFNINSSIQLNPIVLDDTCGNSMGSITLNQTNGIPPITYSWNTSPAQHNNFISNLGAGTYSVTVVENNNCITTQSYNLLDMPAPNANFILPSKACIGDSILVQYVGNQTPPDSFSWQMTPASVLSGTGLGPYLVSYTDTGKYYIQLFVNKQACPSTTSTDSIRLFKIQASVDSLRNVSCYGGNDAFIKLKVTGGVSPYYYTWSPGGTNSAINNHASNGTYIIHINDSIGCKSTVVAHVVQPQKLLLSLLAVKTSCSYASDGSIHAQLSGGTLPYQYHWLSGNFPNTSSISGLCVGTYQLNVVDKNNCKDSSQQFVDYSIPINTDFRVDFETQFSKSRIANFTFTGSGAHNYYWNFGDGFTSSIQNPSHRYTDDTTYLVRLITDSGSPYFCADTSQQKIRIVPPFNLFIPTAFTPNGDGINDIFNLFGNRIKQYKIIIFNRWGQLIFESNSISNSWDGTYQQHPAEEGVYSYLIKVVGVDDKNYTRVGTVSLYR